MRFTVILKKSILATLLPQDNIPKQTIKMANTNSVLAIWV